MTIIYLLLAVLGGVSLAIQGPVNTALGNRTNKYMATCISFLGGAVIYGILLPFIGKGDLGKLSEVRFWQVIGGAYGAVGVYSMVAAMPVIGVALSLMSSLLGQIIAGAIIDIFGLFEVPKAVISPLSIGGIVLVAVGIFFIYRGSPALESNGTRSNPAKRLLMMALAFLGGALGAIQSPTNASLARLVGNSEASFISFVVGFLAILIIALLLRKADLRQLKGAGIKPWMCIGGSFGCVFVLSNILAIPYLGSALLVACTMAGQLSGGIVLDSLGILETPKVKINANRIIGVVIIVVADILIFLGK